MRLYTLTAFVSAVFPVLRGVKNVQPLAVRSSNRLFTSLILSDMYSVSRIRYSLWEPRALLPILKVTTPRTCQQLLYASRTARLLQFQLDAMLQAATLPT